ncbi:hypothetical protein H072_6899 [Dactylellina haptotyla CBS 200.50]|uniref:RING-type domain-containing protein n=1 Tax=Dactylellina haptotyla (strain CBS 200.50) TaxID=1284197 RepID=S8A8W8_DACHA|nr:hypothetical protein H072_6899 [Dactylellina haptotyla CBS 200.50]
MARTGKPSVLRRGVRRFRRIFPGLSARRPTPAQLIWQVLFWLVFPNGTFPEPAGGFTNCVPDSSKHYSYLLKFSAALRSLKYRSASLYLNVKEDDGVFVKRAFGRYARKRDSTASSIARRFTVEDDGRVENWKDLAQPNVRPNARIYGPIRACRLAVEGYSIKENAGGEQMLFQTYGNFSPPWIGDETAQAHWRRAVELSFFGTEVPWNLVCFDTPIDNLDAEQLRNRIAVLGESIGWTPETLDSSYDKDEEEVLFHQERLGTCFLCYEQTPLWKMGILYCEHACCVECLRRNFKMCLDDTSRLPPRCCKKIPNIYASLACDSDSDLTKLARWAQTDGNAASVTSCYSCKADIYATSVMGDIALCLACDSKMCVKCHTKWHEDLERVECRLGQLGKLIDIINDSKWAQCFSCGQIVERSGGCAHMMCRCGVGFCYHCGGRWPKCPCRTTGTRKKVDFKRDEIVQDSGEKYNKAMKAKHKSQAVLGDQKFRDTMDTLKLLRIFKNYQESVARQIVDLRKRLQIVREEEKRSEAESADKKKVQIAIRARVRRRVHEFPPEAVRMSPRLKRKRFIIF